MQNNVPVLAIVGNSNAGKDVCSEWLRDNTILRYKGSCSYTGCAFIAQQLGISWHEAWRTRHERKQDWFKLLNQYRETDPARIVRETVAHSDVVCGIRDRTELLIARQEKLIDLVVWIDRVVPQDPVLTLTIDDADVIIRNYTSFEDFYARLRRLATVLNILKKGGDNK